MSQDATGLWSGRAQARSVCPVCSAVPGERCVLSKGDEDGAHEHGVHLARTEAYCDTERLIRAAIEQERELNRPEVPLGLGWLERVAKAAWDRGRRVGDTFRDFDEVLRDAGFPGGIHDVPRTHLEGSDVEPLWRGELELLITLVVRLLHLEDRIVEAFPAARDKLLDEKERAAIRDHLLPRLEELAVRAPREDGEDVPLETLSDFQRAEKAEARVAELERRLETTPPWPSGLPLSDEEMAALRARWSTGPERYQADADALIATVFHLRLKARTADVRTAEMQAALELYGKLLADLFPGLRASGSPFEHAESVVAQIREILRTRSSDEQARAEDLETRRKQITHAEARKALSNPKILKVLEGIPSLTSIAATPGIQLVGYDFDIEVICGKDGIREPGDSIVVLTLLVPRGARSPRPGDVWVRKDGARATIKTCDVRIVADETALGIGQFVLYPNDGRWSPEPAQPPRVDEKKS